MTPQEPLLVWEYIGHLPRSRIHCEGEKSLTITKAQCIELNFPTHIMHFCFSGVTPCISYFWMSSAASSSVAILCGWNINGVNDTHRTKTDIGNTIPNIGNINVPCVNRAALIVGSTFLIDVNLVQCFLGVAFLNLRLYLGFLHQFKKCCEAGENFRQVHVLFGEMVISSCWTHKYCRNEFCQLKSLTGT